MLEALDYTVLALYLAVVAALGLWAGRREQGTEDYFLGGRSVPWWAAGLSILATETSALTFIGAPQQSLLGDWTYLQIAFGSVLARFVVAWLLIPAYYEANVFTVYGYLEQRFGSWSKNAASVLFVVGRCLGSGVRLFAAALAFQIVVPGTNFALVLAVIALVAVLYSAMGGIKAVIWTDVLQGVLLFGGGGVALVYLVTSLDGGAGAALDTLHASLTASGHDKLRVFNLSFDPKDASTLVGGVIGAMFLTMATHGTDQDMVQRMLTCHSSGAGRRSLWTSAVLTIPVVILFLAIGSLLYVHYGDQLPALAGDIARQAGETDPAKGYKYVFPYWAVHALPVGIRGLILAGLFAAAMSSLDSAVSALSSTAVKNFWEPYVQPGREDVHYLRVARGMSFVFGLVLVGIALLVWRVETDGTTEQGFGILILGLKVLSWVFPPVLGVFFVGVLTRRGNDRANLLALAVGIGVLLVVEFWGTQWPGAQPPFSWVWNALIGCALSFAIAVAFPAPAARRMTA